MKKFTKSLLIFCLFFGVFVSPTVFANKTVENIYNKTFNFRSAVQYALANSPQLKAVRKALEINKLELKNSFYAAFPKLDVSSSHSLHQGAPESPDVTRASNLNLNASANLYNNGQDITNYRKAKLRVKIAELRYNQNRDQLIRDVITDFLDLSLQKKMYAIQKANLTTYRQQYKSALTKYKQGIKTQRDVLRLYNQKRRAEINVLQYKNQIAVSKNRLLTKLGIKPTSESSNQIKFNTLHLKPLNGRKVPTAAPLLKQQYEYKNFVLQERLNTLDVDLARREFLPQVDLTAGSGIDTGSQEGFFGGINDFGHHRQLDTHVNLEFKYRIFNWGTDQRNVTISKEQGMQILEDLRQQLLGIQSDLTDLMLDLKQNKLSYQISNELKTSELKSYNAQEQLYRNGSSSYLDLVNAISDLSAAKTQYINDRYALEKALYRYYYYKGIIYEKTFN